MSSRQTADSYGLFAFLFFFTRCEMKAVACQWMIVYRKIKQILRKCKFLTISVCGGCICRFHWRSHFFFHFMYLLMATVDNNSSSFRETSDELKHETFTRVEWCVRAQSPYTRDHFSRQRKAEDKNIQLRLKLCMRMRFVSMRRDPFPECHFLYAFSWFHFTFLLSSECHHFKRSQIDAVVRPSRWRRKTFSK